jgi:hypothetical protein
MPEGPFTSLQIDFIGPLPRSREKTHALVVVDRFSRIHRISKLCGTNFVEGGDTEMGLISDIRF